jgi:TetR/AcrR family transcriptional regulator, transcriptional repressor for nem operon
MGYISIAPLTSKKSDHSERGLPMRYSAEHKQETRARILDAAGQLFRKEGYGGSGIEALTRTAGVTNGAFYGHFRSKSEAFRTAVVAGLEQLRVGIIELKAKRGKHWLKTFVDIYLGPKRTCDIGQGCALPSLSPEVMRADTRTKGAYEAELLRIIGEIASGLSPRPIGRTDDVASALLALLSGGVTLARAVPDPVLSDRIARAVARAALAMAAPSARS